MSDNTHKNINNVRQFGSDTGSHSSQNQILSALDTLGAKLVRSESERETMRRLLNEALEAQDRLETQIERSQIHTQRQIDQMETLNPGLSEEDKLFIDSQKEKQAHNQEFLEEQLTRQLRIEDKLRDATQTIQKLQRKLDSQEQKRAKMQRRIERVETIAADAQNALEAKALVLLTDQSEQVRHLQLAQEHYAQQAIGTLNNLHDVTPANDAETNNSFVSGFKKNGSVLAILVALGLGWVMATTLNDTPTLFLNDNGELAQIKVQTTNTELVTPTNTGIDTELTALETDWITQDILDQALTNLNQPEPIATTPTAFDILETVQNDDITIDRDLTLPADIKLIEDKAFARIPEAQHDLAALYTAGQGGITQNYERAAFWFEQAAQQGIGNAAYNLGVLYQQGLGKEQDIQRALDWYRRAAQLGHPEAQYNLGIAYIEGVGTRYNPAMAAAFFQQAAFGGITEAAYNLGLVLENGLLGEVRPKDALTWYRGAADNGNNEAQLALENLAQTMNIPIEQAGLLPSGQSLASLINPTAQSLEPAAGNTTQPIDLGTLIPSEDQIMVAQIQEQLRKARLYNGPQDGIVGAGTVKAIKSYQRQQNLPTDGTATAELLTFMLQDGTD